MEGSVNDALKMRVDQNLRHALSQNEHLFHGKRSLLPNDLLKARAIEKFHKDNGGVIVFLNLENFNEVRVI